MDATKTTSILLYLSLDEADLAYNRQGLISPSQRQKILRSMAKTIAVFGAITLLVIVFILTMLLGNDIEPNDKIISVVPVIIFYIPIYWLVMRPSIRMFLNARQDQQVDPVEMVLYTEAKGAQKTILMNNRQARTVIKPELFARIQSGQIYRLYIAHVSRNIVGAEPLINSGEAK
ncbi:MAG: hypothetical protein ABI700_05940 [Chloroflexota bacterium]